MLEVHSAKGDRRAHAATSAEIASAEAGMEAARKKASAGDLTGHEGVLAWQLRA